MGETAPLRHGESGTDTPAPPVPIPHDPPPASIPAQATGPEKSPTPTRAAPWAVILRLHLPATVEAVPRARHALCGAVRADIAADPLATVELLVSELVTNAVQHSPQSTTVTVEVLRDERTLRISVTDAGAPLPRPRRPVTAVDEHGRGLLLVEALAASWGCCPVRGGKIVWCDVDLLTG